MQYILESSLNIIINAHRDAALGTITHICYIIIIGHNTIVVVSGHYIIHLCTIRVINAITNTFFLTTYMYYTYCYLKISNCSMMMKNVRIVMIKNVLGIRCRRFRESSLWRVRMHLKYWLLPGGVNGWTTHPWNHPF